MPILANPGICASVNGSSCTYLPVKVTGFTSIMSTNPFPFYLVKGDKASLVLQSLKVPRERHAWRCGHPTNIPSFQNTSIVHAPCRRKARCHLLLPNEPHT